MRIAICDDNQHFIDELSDVIIDNYQSLDLRIDSFHCGEDLVKHYKSGKAVFDVVLLDIEMGELNGLQTAEILRRIDRDAIIIIITSHIELALSGYEVSAFRFLTKPLNEKKLIKAIEAVKAQIKSEKIIQIKNADGEFSVNVKDILYIEAEGQNVSVRLNDKAISHRYNLGDYMRELADYDFVSVHRSYLVNLYYVKRFTNQDVTLEGNITVPISRLRYQKFKQQFHRYISMTSI